MRMIFNSPTIVSRLPQSFGRTLVCAGLMAAAAAAAGAQTPGREYEVCTSSGCRMVDPSKPKAARAPERSAPAAATSSIEEYRGEALSALQEQALAGDAVAAYKLASVYDRGLAGVERDRSEAIRFYKIGADAGHAGAARGAAIALLSVEALPVVSTPPVKPVSESSPEPLEGAPAPTVELAVEPTPKPPAEDVQAAMGYLFQAADAGDPIARLELAKQLYSGVYLGRDVAGAGQVFQELADAGNADAQYFVGQMHFRGTGRPQNGYQAITWTRKAAVNGSMLGQRALGRLYINGYDSIGKDRVEASRWLTAAAQNGDPESARLLELLRSGRYVPGTDLTSVLSGGDIIKASDAALRGIEDMRARLARGEDLAGGETIGWGDGDGDGKSDGQTTVTPAGGASCYTIEHLSFIEGQSVRREERVCEAADGTFQTVA